MSTTAIISCDHGLGHLRRSILFAGKLGREEMVHIYAPRESVLKLSESMEIPDNIHFIDLRTRSTPEGFRGKLDRITQWVDQLQSLDTYETVICDNLPEILLVRPDAIISAQFFWHDVIEGVSPDYNSMCQRLLHLHNPLVIGCATFSMDAVKRCNRYVPASMYEIPELTVAARGNRGKGKGLLISGGSTEILKPRLTKIVEEFAQKRPKDFDRVFVDRYTMPSSAPDWMVLADFSISMYLAIRAAICRPGLGVVTDLLTVGAHIAPVYEVGNREMRHNSLIIKTLQADMETTIARFVGEY
jgi:hypothetical protein